MAMNVTFVGGGALRLVGILRSALAVKGVLDGGEIRLVDLDPSRAETVGNLLLKSPENARAKCRIRWSDKLDPMLEGADVVGVVLMAGSPLSYRLSEVACTRTGFIGSDNVSPCGAMLALKGAPILMNVARRMERLCPQAWLLDFANPVAVLSGMINNHTKIKCLGVCAGFTNHRWDLSRLLGRDELCTDVDVDVAGINHLSFILRGKMNDRDLFSLLDEHCDDRWTPMQVGKIHAPVMRKSIREGLQFLIDIYRALGALIFSTEGDGMAHLMHDRCVDRVKRQGIPTRRQIETGIRRTAESRKAQQKTVASWLKGCMDEAFWAKAAVDAPWTARQDCDIFVQAMKGISGVQPTRIAASRPNCGAVKQLDDRTVIEYSQIIHRQKTTPVKNLFIPASVSGMVGALAIHQTLLGDALAANDPRLLAQALLAYPIHAYSHDARRLYRELLTINQSEISPELMRAEEYL